MMNFPTTVRVLLLAVAPLTLLGCVQAQFNIELVDAKTMLENQVLGSYAELGEDVWMVSNVRAAEDPIYGYEPSIFEGELDPEKATSLSALLDSLYIADEVTRLKINGLIGETSEGYLALAPGGEEEVYAEEVVWRENNNRGLIYARLAITTPELAHSPDARAEVERIFAQYYLERLQPGMFYLNEAGDWQQL